MVSSPSLVYRSGELRLYYRRSGSGPAVVLIHGLSGSRRWWRYNVPALERAHTVYVVELVGFGHLRHQRALGVQAAARLIGEWLDSLELTDGRAGAGAEAESSAGAGAGGAALIGHSMGGQIALRVAALRPERVSALVLACASGLLHQRWWRVALRLPTALAASRRSFVPTILVDGLRAGLPNLIRSSRDLLRDDVAELLPTLQVPTLVVWGGRDPLIPPALGQAIAAGIPGARYRVLPEAGHVVMVDDAVGFNRLVLAFLGGQLPEDQRPQDRPPGDRPPGRQPPEDAAGPLQDAPPGPVPA